eukprot:787206-Prymnesium_polylepis.1
MPPMRSAGGWHGAARRLTWRERAAAARGAARAQTSSARLTRHVLGKDALRDIRARPSEIVTAQNAGIER